jgi:hypothetical protein
VSSFTVVTPSLAAAAAQIDACAALAAAAGAALLAGQGAAFGSEPIAGAFAGMCARARSATAELDQTVAMLSRNVAAAAVGYLVTDRGIVAESALPGFKP